MKCSKCGKQIGEDEVYVIFAKATRKPLWFHWYHWFQLTPDVIERLKKWFPGENFDVE